MNAKEERSQNLEIHKMTRSNNELTAKNAALDAECMRLRGAIKQESEKYAAKHAAMMQQFNAATEVEREKMNELQRQFEKERERLTEDAYKDAVAQRAEHRDALGDIKRHLDARYNEKVNENKIALDTAIRQLDEERERIKRDEREQLAQLNEEREKIKQQLNEVRERIKRDEKEQLVQFLFQMDSEREKNQCQLEKERAQMMKQLHDETVAQRQSNADMLAETKMLLDTKHSARMNELNIAMNGLDIAVQELNEERERLRQNEEERRIQLNKERERLEQTVQERLVQLNEERDQQQQTVQERLVQLNEERERLEQTVQERLVQLNEERDQLRQNEEDRLVQLNEERERLEQTVQDRLVQLNEERDQIKRDEKEQHVQFSIYMDSEREKMQCQLEKEQAQLVERARENDVVQRQFNEDALAEMKLQLESKCDAQLNVQMNENAIALDVAMRQLDKQREQHKQTLDEQLEQLKQKLDEEQERNMRDDLEREKMHALQLQLENDQKHVAEQARKDAESQCQSNMDALNEKKKQLDTQFNEQMNKNKLAFDDAMQKINEEHERIKQDDLEREKMKCQLKNDRVLLMEQARNDSAAQKQSNMDVLNEKKKQLDTQFNEQMDANKIAFDDAIQKINEEHARIKKDDLEREKMKCHLENVRVLLMEQARNDNVAQKQSNADALAETRKELDARCNEQMNANKIVFDAAMQKLNKERALIKQTLNEERERKQKDDLERKKIHEFRLQLEKEREQAQKDVAAQRQSNAAMIAETKQQLEAKFNAQINKSKSEFDASTQKINEERDQLKQQEKIMNDLVCKKIQTSKGIFEKERELLAEQARKDEMAYKQSSADALAETRKQLNAQHNEKMNANKIAFDAAMQKLNQDRENLNLDRTKMHDELEKEREQWIEQARNDSAAQKQFNADVIVEIKKQLDSQCNEQMTKNKVTFDAAMHKLNEDQEKLNLDRIKMQALKGIFEKEREQLIEQVHNDDVAQKQTNADALAEKKKQLDARFNELVNKNKLVLDDAMHKLKEDQEKLNLDLTQMQASKDIFEKEREQWIEQSRNDDVVQKQFNADVLVEIKKQLDSQCNEQMNKNNVVFDAAMHKLNEDREKLNLNHKKMHDALEKEREQWIEQSRSDDVAQKQSNANALVETRKQLNVQYNEQMNKNNVAFDAAMQKLNEDRENLNLERAKMQTLKGILEKEREQWIEQARNDIVAQKQSNADALAETRKQLNTQHNEQMNANKIAFDAAMQKLNKDRDKYLAQMQASKDILEKEREQLAEQARNDDVAQKQSNADVLVEVKKQLDSQYNEQIIKNKIIFDAAMQKFNKDREKLNLDHKKMHDALEKERELLAEQARSDDVAQKQSNANALVETRKQLNTQYNEQMNKNKVTFDAAIQKLNEDREKFNLEHIQMCASRDIFEREREQLAIAMQKLKEERHKLKCDEQQKLVRDSALVDEINQLKKQLKEERHKIKCDEEQKLVRDAAVTDEISQLKKQLKEERLKIKHDEQQKLIHNAALNDEINQLKKQLKEERHKIKHDEQQKLIQDTSLLDEMNQLKKQLKEAKEERDKIKCDEQQHANNSDVMALVEEINQLKRQSKEDQEKHAQTKTRNLKLNKSEVECMQDAIDSNYAHMQLIHTLNFSEKRVMIYSHYSDKNEVESYNLLTIECVQHYFDYIIILTNCPNKWNIHSPNYNKCHLLAYNMKSDFRNYGVFIMQTAKTLVNASRVCLINDSFVIVDVNAFGYCVKSLFDSENMSHDFIGLTSSHEGIFHLQSYFMCFNSTSLPAIMSYFETRGLPTNHQAAISDYELGITSYLIDKGFSSHAVVSNDDMRHPLNTTCCKWSAVLKDIGIIKRQHFFKRYAYAAMTDANISVVAENYSYNKHLMHFLKYNGIHVNVA